MQADRSKKKKPLCTLMWKPGEEGVQAGEKVNSVK